MEEREKIKIMICHKEKKLQRRSGVNQQRRQES